jgi:hypothetical protein
MRTANQQKCLRGENRKSAEDEFGEHATKRRGCKQVLKAQNCLLPIAGQDFGEKNSPHGVAERDWGQAGKKCA